MEAVVAFFKTDRGTAPTRVLCLLGRCCWGSKLGDHCKITPMMSEPMHYIVLAYVATMPLTKTTRFPHAGWLARAGHESGQAEDYDDRNETQLVSMTGHQLRLNLQSSCSGGRTTDIGLSCIPKPETSTLQPSPSHVSRSIINPKAQTLQPRTVLLMTLATSCSYCKT